jgi:energy-coupling factor transporter ATP-binding protein EcfA2
VSEPLLVVRARRLRAARGVVVARDVALTAAPGDVVAVEGPNGSGKSTLLAAAAGLLPDLKIVGLHLAAAVFGAGLGSLLALIERAGWRLLAAVAVFLVLFVARTTPMAPLLRLSTHPATLATPVGGAAAWLVLPGLALAAAAAFLATRLT